MVIIKFTKTNFFLFIACFALFEVNAQSVGGIISGTTLVCPNATNTGFLSLIGYTGTIVEWDSTIDGGATWHIMVATFPPYSHSYQNITQTTCYRVIVKDAAFPPDTSTTACITIYPPSVGGTVNGGGEFCDSSESDTMHLSGYTGKVLYWEYSTNNGISWTIVADTTTELIHPNITQNTIYQAIVRNGPSCPTDTSSQAFFVIDPVTVAGIISGSDTVCYGVSDDSLILSGNVGNVLYWLSSTDGGSTWNTLSNTTHAQTYSGLTQTTWYAAVVQSGVCKVDTTSLAEIRVRIPTP